MKKLMTLLCSLFFTQHLLGQQGVGIGTESPDPSALLHIKESNNKGILIPRLNTTQISAMNAESKGLLVYDLTSDSFKVFDGDRWEDIRPLPSGSIIMWSGSIEDIPYGWVLCDGQSYDLDGSVLVDGITTPDLRGHFLVSYDDRDLRYNEILKKGGENLTKLTIDQMPRHNHLIDSRHSHPIAISGSGHNHSIEVDAINIEATGSIIGGPAATYPGTIFNLGFHTEVSEEVTTDIDIDQSFTGVTMLQAGESQNHENRPPYFVLAYIMKL